MSNCSCKTDANVIPQILLGEIESMPSEPCIMCVPIPVDWRHYAVLDPGYTESVTWYWALSPDCTVVRLYDVSIQSHCDATTWARQVLNNAENCMKPIADRGDVQFEAFLINAVTSQSNSGPRVCETYWNAVKAQGIEPVHFGPMAGFFPCKIGPQSPDPEKQVRSSAEAEALNKTKTYGVAVKCTNCGYKGDVMIAIGREVGFQECPACGCQRLDTREPELTVTDAEFARIQCVKRFMGMT